MKLYEELLSSSEVSKLVTLVNDLRASGRRGQLPGKLFIMCLECGTCQLSLDLDEREVRELAKQKTNQSHFFHVEHRVAVSMNDMKRPLWVVASFYASFCFGVSGLWGLGVGWIGDEQKVCELAYMEKKHSHLFYLEHLVAVSVNDMKRPPGVLVSFYASFCLGLEPVKNVSNRDKLYETFFKGEFTFECEARITGDQNDAFTKVEAYSFLL